MLIDDLSDGTGSGRGDGRFRRLRAVGWILLGVLGAPALVDGARAETWRGLTVAPEHRCSPYDRKRDYECRQAEDQLPPAHDARNRS